MSPMSDDPNEFLALTPGHFLRGAPLISTPETPTENMKFRDRWERIKSLSHQFAQRWKTEYLAELQKRYKWQHREENIQVGQLVVIKDDTLPPNEWKLARIIRTYFGDDGLVRVADLKTQTGVVTRAISKLCVLPIDPNDSEGNQFMIHVYRLFLSPTRFTHSSFAPFYTYTAIVINFFSFSFSYTSILTEFSINRAPRNRNIHLCLICHSYHPLRYCKRFQKMSIEERQRRVRQHGYCRNCLARSHCTDECTSSMVCQRCGWFHHTLLHVPKGQAHYSQRNQKATAQVTENCPMTRKMNRHELRIRKKKIEKPADRHRSISRPRNDEQRRILQRAIVALERLRKAL